jgi:hypothetical protein
VVLALPRLPTPSPPGTDFLKLYIGRKIFGQTFAFLFWTNFSAAKTADKYVSANFGLNS